MRKYLILLCAAFALFACGKIEPEFEAPKASGIPVSDLVFDISVEYTAETKATKQGWQNGTRSSLLPADLCPVPLIRKARR